MTTYPSYTTLKAAATALGLPEALLYAVCNTHILPAKTVWIHPETDYLICESWLKDKQNQLPTPDLEDEEALLDWLKR